MAWEELVRWKERERRMGVEFTGQGWKARRDTEQLATRLGKRQRGAGGQGLSSAGAALRLGRESWVRAFQIWELLETRPNSVLPVGRGGV